MEWRELIVDGYDRLPEVVEEVLAGVRAADLDWPPRPGANPLGWTVWHLTRVQDAQIADLMGEPDLWTRDGWHAKFDRPPVHDDHGYGHTAAQVRAFRSPEREGPARLSPRDHGPDQAVPRRAEPRRAGSELDESWYTPRPTVAVRILSILADCHHHAGEASYIRGLLKARAARPGRRRPGAAIPAGHAQGREEAPPLIRAVPRPPHGPLAAHASTARRARVTAGRVSS